MARRARSVVGRSLAAKLRTYTHTDTPAFAPRVAPPLQRADGGTEAHHPRGNTDSLAEAFCQVVFNIAAANRDDHTKNLAFLLAGNAWQLAPSCDSPSRTTPTVAGLPPDGRSQIRPWRRPADTAPGRTHLAIGHRHDHLRGGGRCAAIRRRPEVVLASERPVDDLTGDPVGLATGITPGKRETHMPLGDPLIERRQPDAPVRSDLTAMPYGSAIDRLVCVHAAGRSEGPQAGNRACDRCTETVEVMRTVQEPCRNAPNGAQTTVTWNAKNRPRTAGSEGGACRNRTCDLLRVEHAEGSRDCRRSRTRK